MPDNMWTCIHEETSDNWACSCGYRLKSNDHPCYNPIVWCHECGTEVSLDLDGNKKPSQFFADYWAV